MTERKARIRGIIVTIIFALFEIGGITFLFGSFDFENDLNNLYFIDILVFTTIFIAGYRGRNIGKKMIIDQKDNFKDTHHFLTFTTTISFTVATLLWKFYQEIPHDIFFTTLLWAFLVLIISTVVNLLLAVFYIKILTKF